MSKIVGGVELFTMSEVIKKLGCTYSELWLIIDNNNIPTTKIDNLLYVDINDFIRTCIVCGAKLGKRRRVFCSEECEVNSKKSLQKEYENGQKKEKEI